MTQQIDLSANHSPVVAKSPVVANSPVVATCTEEWEEFDISVEDERSNLEFRATYLNCI